MNITLANQTVTAVHTQAAFPTKGTVELRKIDKELPDENTYLKINDIDFHNGTIEVDVCGLLLPDAPDYARGFIGIVFRANESDSGFESFYIRPSNGKDCSDPVRRAHGCQYFSYPGYTFSYFREFGIDKYEGCVDTIALGEWSHIRAEIIDDQGCSMSTDKRCWKSTASNMDLIAGGLSAYMSTSGLTVISKI